MKDNLGHGSNSRGDGGGRQLDAHQAARKEIQLHPNDPNQNAESVLHYATAPQCRNVSRIPGASNGRASRYGIEGPNAEHGRPRA